MSRYQYETSPRKIRTDYEPVKKRKNNKNIQVTTRKEKKTKKISKLKTLVYVVIGFATFFTISYRNAIIDTKYAEIKTLKSELAVVEKENEQLEATIESSLNLQTIQQEAEEKLGMTKLTNSQIEYVNLPKTDYVEAKVEEVKIEEEEGYISKIISIIKNLIK